MKTLYLRNVKKGFATNSSSYHSTLIMTDEEYKKWVNNEIEVEGYSHDEWYREGEYEDYYSSVEYDEETYTAPDGTVIRFLCRYGYDG